MAETRVVPDVPRRDDAFLVDGVRVCPLAENQRRECWWVLDGHPKEAAPTCVCRPPMELWRRGR